MVFSQINPLAQKTDHFCRPSFLFQNARSAFKALLQNLNFDDKDCVLLPAYVGWSSKEGSGVFDPISDLGLQFSFYRLDSRLRVDLNDYYDCFRSKRVKLVVIIHYFGYVDTSYPEIVSIAKEHGAYVVEDEAHALMTDLVGGESGRLGDACIFSLHKMLPVSSGGMLMLNSVSGYNSDWQISSEAEAISPWMYDLQQIARQRQTNALLLSNLIQRLKGKVDPLWEPPKFTEIPQSFPVVVRTVSRDQLYFAMREAGFGVVSLYHTLISAITSNAYPVSHQLSHTIFNLPVHQDIDTLALQLMVDKMDECLRVLEG